MKKVILCCMGVAMFICASSLSAGSSMSPKDSVTEFINSFKKKKTESYLSLLFFYGPNPMDKMTPEMETMIHKQLSTVLSPWLNSKIVDSKETDDYAVVTAYELLKDKTKAHNLQSIYLVKIDNKWRVSPALSHPVPKKGHDQKEFSKQIEILKKWYDEKMDSHTSVLCPKVVITDKEIPYTKKITLSPGCALNIILPDKKNLAIWCNKTGRFSLPGDSDLRLRYGENPFSNLEIIWLDQPGGSKVAGPYKSYIRSGSVGTWSSGPGHEYTLFIDDKYRVKLRGEGDVNGILPVKISVNMATKHERIRPENEVEYLLGQLKQKDSQQRIKAIKELQSELMLGDTYAVPKWQYIIDKIKPLDKDSNPQVQKQASDTLRVIGDAESIMKVISPEPKGEFLTFNEALALGQFAKRCKKLNDKKKIFAHVKTFFGAKKPELRAFAVAFFAYSEKDNEVKKALRKAQNDSSAKVRKAVVFALESLYEGKAGVANRVKMLDDSDPEVIIAALESSVGRGSENEFPIDKVKGFLKSENKKIKLAAIQALQFKDNKEAEKLLLPLTYDQDDDIRVKATYALCGEKSTAVYKRMLELLNDEHQLVKVRALQNFYLDDYVDAIPHLRSFLKTEKNKDLLEIANEALKKLIRLKEKGI